MKSTTCWMRFGGDLREVRPLREPAPEDSVAVLDGPLLVCGIRPRVVDAGAERLVELRLVEELAAVVRDDGADRAENPFCDEMPDREQHTPLRDPAEFLDEVLAAEAIEEDQQSALAAGAGHHRVHLQMPRLRGQDGFRRAVVELAASEDGPGGMGGVSLAAVPSPVDQILLAQADVAALHVVVERPQAGDVLAGVALDEDAAGIVQRTVTVLFADEGPELVGNSLEKFLARALLRGLLVRVGLGGVRVVLAILVVLRLGVPDRLRAPAPKVLAAPGTLVDAHGPGEAPEGERRAEGVDEPVPLPGEMEPLLIREVFPRTAV